MSDKVLEELAEWIDQTTLAECILDELQEKGIEPTLENGQKVWLNFLETALSLELGSVIDHIY